MKRISDGLFLRIWSVGFVAILAGCSSENSDTAAPAPSVLDDPALPGSDERPVERVRNAANLAPEDEELIEQLLHDPWVAEVEGELVVEVEHGDGNSFVTFEYETSRNTNEFRFNHDGCGIQPDVVTGVRFFVEPGDARPGVPWTAKSFTWRTESSEVVSCVPPPPPVQPRSTE